MDGAVLRFVASIENGSEEKYFPTFGNARVYTSNGVQLAQTISGDLSTVVIPPHGVDTVTGVSSFILERFVPSDVGGFSIAMDFTKAK